MIILLVYMANPAIPHRTVTFTEDPFNPNQIEDYVYDCSTDPLVYDVQMRAVYTLGESGPRMLQRLGAGTRTGNELHRWLNYEEPFVDTGNDVQDMRELRDYGTDFGPERM